MNACLVPSTTDTDVGSTECVRFFVSDEYIIGCRKGVQVNSMSRLVFAMSLTWYLSWFQHLSVMGGFFGWLSINLTYMFFCEYPAYLWITDELMNHTDRGLQYQGIERQKLHYYNPLQVSQSYQNA